MARPDQAQLIETFRQMTSGELAEFVRRFEETFGVAAAGLAAAATRWQDMCIYRPEILDLGHDWGWRDVLLEAAGPQRIHTIKVVRQLTRLAPGPAKELVERAPTLVLGPISREEADLAADALREVGATVSIRVIP